MTTLQDRITLAARAICKQHALTCNVNEQDAWTQYSNEFKEDAEDVLKAALVGELEAQLRKWETTLTAVMPADFKDWHQNSKAEWPDIAALVITNLRKHIDEDAAYIARLEAQVAALTKDAARIDALSTPGWELSMNSNCECADDELWVVHLCSGGRNDREWRLIGSGADPRAAIDAAIDAQKGTP